MRCRIALFSPDDRMLKRLADIGEVVWVPLIKLKPIEGSSIKAVEALRKCPTAVFVSPRTAEILVRDAERLGLKDVLVNLVRSSVIAVIGKGTEESILTYFGVKPHIVSPKPYTRDLLYHLRSRGVDCATLLKAEVDSVDLGRVEGLSISVVNVYRYEVIEENIDVVEKLVESFDIDVLAVTSYTIAKVLCKNIGKITSIPVVTLGKTTARGVESFCYEGTKVVVGDGTVETLRNILTKICSSPRTKALKV